MKIKVTREYTYSTQFCGKTFSIKSENPPTKNWVERQLQKQINQFLSKVDTKPAEPSELKHEENIPLSPEEREKRLNEMIDRDSARAREINNNFKESIPGFVHASIGGPTKVLMIAGRKHYFEMHRQLGPMATTKTGNGIKGTKTFWYAVTCWIEQGCVEKDGVCVWKPTKGGI